MNRGRQRSRPGPWSSVRERALACLEAFLTLHRTLREALPRHRRELDEIAGLARPLMPARMQPPRIGRPRPDVRPLALPASRYDWSVSPLRRAA